MKTEEFSANGKEAVLYLSENRDRPLVILNNYSNDSTPVIRALRDLNCDEFNMLSVGHLNWDHDMTPWGCPPLSEKDTPCTGGADEYLGLLLSEILPKAEAFVMGTPSHIGIAGYSLAGLFALYAMYKCDVFNSAASVSGSLWFPQFKEFVLENSFKRLPDKLYLSFGDREEKTRHPLLKTVRNNTTPYV